MTTKFNIGDTVYFEYCGKIVTDSVEEIRIFNRESDLKPEINYILIKNNSMGFICEEDLFSTFEECQQEMLEIAKMEVQRIESLREK